METIRHLDLFGGIGAMRFALQKLGFNVESKYVDYDKKVVNVYNKLWEEDNKPIDIRDFKPRWGNFDLITAGFPCQPFSQAGKGQGLHDEKGRGDLFLETLKIVSKVKPKYVVFENVKGILNKKHKWIIEEIFWAMKKLAYTVEIELLNSQDFNSVQARQRVFIICTKGRKIKNIEQFKTPLTKTLKDYLEKEVDEKLYYGPDKLEKILNWKAYKKPLNNISTITSTKTKTITTRTQPGTSSQIVVVDNVGGKEKINLEELLENRAKIDGLFYKSFNSENYITGENSKKFGTITAQGANSRQRVLLKDLKIRGITPRETYRLMGFSDEMFDRVKDLPKTNLYFTAGNSMEINTITAVLKTILEGEYNG